MRRGRDERAYPSLPPPAPERGRRKAPASLAAVSGSVVQVQSTHELRRRIVERRLPIVFPFPGSFQRLLVIDEQSTDGFTGTGTVEVAGARSGTFYVSTLPKAGGGGFNGSIECRVAWLIERRTFTEDTVAPVVVVTGTSVRIPFDVNAESVQLQIRSLVAGTPGSYTVAVAVTL